MCVNTAFHLSTHPLMGNETGSISLLLGTDYNEHGNAGASVVGCRVFRIYAQKWYSNSFVEIIIIV